MITLSELLRRWRMPLRAAAALAIALGGGFAALAASKAEDPSAILTLLLGAAAVSVIFPPTALVFVVLSEARDYIRGRGRHV